MQQKIEKIMCLKPAQKLPAAFKYLGDYAPLPLEKVIVIDHYMQGNNCYVRVRFGAKTCTVHRSNLWTIGQLKFYYNHQK